MSYHVWIKDEAKNEIRQLPGHMRQRVRQAIRDLSGEPHPHDSQPMKSPIPIEISMRLRRTLRYENGTISATVPGLKVDVRVVPRAWN